jgi:hypothetical protein
VRAAELAEAEEVNRFEDDYLFGNWGGLRSRLWERGIDARLLLIIDPYSMLRGDVYVDINKAMQSSDVAPPGPRLTTLSIRSICLMMWSACG